jgi:hypothetical protein
MAVGNLVVGIALMAMVRKVLATLKKNNSIRSSFSERDAVQIARRLKVTNAKDVATKQIARRLQISSVATIIAVLSQALLGTPVAHYPIGWSMLNLLSTLALVRVAHSFRFG